MLTNAIQKNHSSLSLEILTLNDLQTNQLQTNPKPNNTIDDKLYLILTYAVAFDRVHYPLPLQLQNSLDNSSQLKIKSLEIDYANALKELSMLMKENDRLQYELKQKSKTDLQIQNLPDFELKVSKISRDLKKIDPGTCRHYKIHQNLESIIIDLLDLVSLDDIPSRDSNHSRPSSLIRSNNSKNRLQTKSNDSVGGRKKGLESTSSNEPSKSRLSTKKNEIKTKFLKKSTENLLSRSGYKIIKSEPLEQVKRSSSQSSIKRHTSTSPFQRFDPTQYVREKEAKLKRSRRYLKQNSFSSRNHSRSNSTSGSINQLSRSSSVKSDTSNQHKSKLLYKSTNEYKSKQSMNSNRQRQSSSDRINQKPRLMKTETDGMKSKNRNRSLSKDRYMDGYDIDHQQDQPPLIDLSVPMVDYPLIPLKQSSLDTLDSDGIEYRLEQLQLFLKNSLN
ncbi:hypothetical protein HDV02_002271 [Globomyces sp. JEL0801]|nr:hypothetical protein HDV02_002271 [Globomyces sp. JEL0801]